MNNALGILGMRCVHVSWFENPRKSREYKENFQCKKKSMYVASPKILVYWKRGVSVDMGQANMVILMQKYQEGHSLSAAFPT